MKNLTLAAKFAAVATIAVSGFAQTTNCNPNPVGGFTCTTIDLAETQRQANEELQRTTAALQQQQESFRRQQQELQQQQQQQQQRRQQLRQQGCQTRSGRLHCN